MAVESGIPSCARGCAGCLETFEENELFYACSQVSCGQTYHATCIGQPEPIKNDDLKWTCPECVCMKRRGGDNSGTPVRGSSSQVYISPATYDINVTKRSKARSARNMVEESEPSFASLAEEIRSFRNDFCSFKTQMLELTHSLTNFQTKLEEVERRTTTNEKRLEKIEEQIINNAFLKARLEELEAKSNKQEQISRVGPRQKSSHNLSKRETPSATSATVGVVAKGLPSEPIGSTSPRQHLSLIEQDSSVLVALTKDGDGSIHISKQNSSSSDGSTPHSSYSEVTKNPKKPIQGVVRGSGKQSESLPLLVAAEQPRYIHLYYVQVGTLSESVKEYVDIITGTKTCHVETLKARGQYASFKIGVPSSLYETVMTPDKWPENVCIKPWTKNFYRPKGNQLSE